ncbi:MAG: ABC transporter ATP-binding protein [Clostridia bacterium]|nr:ABC transporter ATP-binding protein [Clostridia bacterium]
MKKATLLRLIGYIKKSTPALILTLVLAAATVILNLYIPILAGEAIDCIVSKGNVNFELLVPILIKIGVYSAVSALLSWCMNVINNRIAYHTVRDMRNDAFKKLNRLPISYIDSHPHGDLVSRIVTDTETVSDGLIIGFTNLFSGVMTIIATLAFMLSINVYITLVVVVVTPISLLVAKFIASRTYSLFKQQSETVGEETAFINEYITGQKTVKAYSREVDVTERFDEINERLRRHSLKAIFYSSITNPSTRFVNSIVYMGVALFGCISIISGSGLTVGNLSAFLSYANQYTKPFNEISGVITELQNAFACADRVFSLLDEQEQTPDADNAVDLVDANGNVLFKNVDFSYTSDRELIKDLSLCIKSGQHIAIVGPTGCGKTTLINLLMRFYDVDSGEISVDGVDIRNIKRCALRRNYGMVLQDTWIMSGSVRDNIRLGNPDATDEEVIDAAKRAHAHSFIKRLPNGYDTVISDNGGLSQGQKQLLCVARIMLTTPSMLILDEATSSIDTRTEMKIQDAFSVLMKEKTAFIVAHRLSTIKNADMIIVMNNGNIVETGSHSDLIKQAGFYAKLYNSQFDRAN